MTNPHSLRLTYPFPSFQPFAEHGPKIGQAHKQTARIRFGYSAMAKKRTEPAHDNRVMLL
jgi:hypothetical protein